MRLETVGPVHIPHSVVLHPAQPQWVDDLNNVLGVIIYAQECSVDDNQ